MAARRVRLPAADDLFRPTAATGEESRSAQATPSRTGRGNRRVRAVPEPEVGSTAAAEDGAAARSAPKKAGTRRSSGRVRHDEKMTVYVTSEELLELEHARLSLRRNHGLAVDRGRLVREAIAIALADVEAHGEESALVRRLAGE